jgi:hypothetical protein
MLWQLTRLAGSTPVVAGPLINEMQGKGLERVEKQSRMYRVNACVETIAVVDGDVKIIN